MSCRVPPVAGSRKRKKPVDAVDALEPTAAAERYQHTERADPTRIGSVSQPARASVLTAWPLQTRSRCTWPPASARSHTILGILGQPPGSRRAPAGEIFVDGGLHARFRRFDSPARRRPSVPRMSSSGQRVFIICAATRRATDAPAAPPRGSRGSRRAEIRSSSIAACMFPSEARLSSVKSNRCAPTPVQNRW